MHTHWGVWPTQLAGTECKPDCMEQRLQQPPLLPPSVPVLCAGWRDQQCVCSIIHYVPVPPTARGGTRAGSQQPERPVLLELRQLPPLRHLPAGSASTLLAALGERTAATSRGSLRFVNQPVFFSRKKGWFTSVRYIYYSLLYYIYAIYIPHCAFVVVSLHQHSTEL